MVLLLVFQRNVDRLRWDALYCRRFVQYSPTVIPCVTCFGPEGGEHGSSWIHDSKLLDWARLVQDVSGRYAPQLEPGQDIFFLPDRDD